MPSDTVRPVVAKTLEYSFGDNVFEVFRAIDDNDQRSQKKNAILVCRRYTPISPVRQCVLIDSS